MSGEPLSHIIREKIAGQGRITFAEFMELALYHPRNGYYNSRAERVGPEGDFTTSPLTHPSFGALIGCQLHEMWTLLGRPSAFTVVEMGAGDGRLCRDILSWLRVFAPGLYREMRYVLVERSDRQRERQVATLAGLRAKRGSVELVADLEGLLPPGVEGCFISNELVDSFPVHRVAKLGGRLQEVYVSLEDGRFVDLLGEPSTPALQEHLDWLGVDLPEGSYGEVNLLAPKWLRQVAWRLQRGFVLTIDYGYTSAELYAPARREGTLLGYRRHGYYRDLYQHVGSQDLTAHVDFSALVKAGESVGLSLAGLTTQQAFLLRLGLGRYAQALRGLGLPAAELQANLRAMDALAHPEKLGRLKVLVQRKGVAAPGLTGLDEAAGGGLRSWERAAALPRLRWRQPRSFRPWLTEGARRDNLYL